MAISDLPWPTWPHAIYLKSKTGPTVVDQDTGIPTGSTQAPPTLLEDASFQAEVTAKEQRHPGANKLLEGDARLYTSAILDAGDTILVHMDDKADGEVHEYTVASTPSRHYGVIQKFVGGTARRGYSLTRGEG